MTDDKEKINRDESRDPNSEQNKSLENMTDEEIHDIALKSVSNMTEEEINKKGAEVKKKHLFAFGFFLTLSVCSLVLAVLCIVFNKISIVAIFIPIFIVAVCFTFKNMKPSQFKYSYRDWVLYENEINTKRVRSEVITTQKKLHDMETIDNKKIKSAKIVDSYTEYSDKLHAFLNYQEIIQTRIYKFLVTFEDDTSKVYTVKEGSKEYNKFMMFLSDEKEEADKSNRISSADELKKYKELLDIGAITQEEYNQKKENLLK